VTGALAAGGRVPGGPAPAHAAAHAPVVLSGWPGTVAGLTAIGACAVLVWFAPRLVPRKWHRHAHPWLYRLVTLLMYCGAVAVLVTPVGQGIIRPLRALVGYLAGQTGVIVVAVDVGALFLFFTVLMGLLTEPHPRAGWYAIALVVFLTLIPAGLPAELLAATSGPGEAAAHAVATALGGH
jgi:hypothetical protein